MLPICSLLHGKIYLLKSSLFPSLTGGVNCRLIIFSLHLKVTCDWVHNMITFQWLCYHIQNGFFQSILFACKFQGFIVFFSWLVFHYKNISHFHYPFLIWGHLGCFQVLNKTNNPAMNIDEELYLLYECESLCIYLKVKLLVLEVNWIPNSRETTTMISKVSVQDCSHTSRA